MAANPDGSLARHAARAACLILFVAVFAPGAAAQQPLYVPPPAGPEFFPRFDFRMGIESLSPPKDTPAEQADERFSWDTRFGGSFDVVDLVSMRAGAIVDVESVEGSEYRPFDVDQINYTLEVFGAGRIGGSEAVAMLRHVSRHLSDRPKRDAVAWNELGARFLHHYAATAATIDLDAEGGYVTERAFVDYVWLAELNVLARHPVSPRVGIFANGRAQLFGTDAAVAGRGTQVGYLVNGGVRLGGRGGVVEVYLGYERRVDAYPLDRVPQHWGLAGLRLLVR